MPCRPCTAYASKTCSGFTLVELLVAMAVMAAMAVMTWQGLDAMARTRAMAQEHHSQAAVLTTGLQQWVQDLDQMVETPPLSIITWDGRVMRLVRHNTGAVSDGLLVVAWTRSVRDVNVAGQGQWLRWQSKPKTSITELRAAFVQADVWAQSAGATEQQHEVSILPLTDMQIYFYTMGAWQTPLRAESQPGESRTKSYTTNSVTIGAAVDGIRLVLTLPPGHPMGGTVTRDWVRPTLSNDKS